ncbi:hypothetical protein BJX63DRAFT_431353 [Aspergillus granulosus]|uniref:HNH nuclease domain-containing protein n=1 Tax=Aspergillus granulosus TaxID=176169 RepID=A0ABR4HI82_9EURO
MDSQRSESSPSSTASSRGSSSRSSDFFSEGVKLRVRNKCGDECWCCSRPDPHVCHVVARDDRKAALWVQRNLLDFPIDSVMNGIALCPSCHEQFNYALDPGFAFIPTDIQFFIEFELADRERRKEAQERGDHNSSARRVPSAEQYQQHQLEQGVITPDSSGGLYRPIFLKPILGAKGIQALTERNRPWYGAPMASLRRAFPILGTGRSQVLGKATRNALERLRNLYFDDDVDEKEEEASNTRKHHLIPSPPAISPPTRKRRHIDKGDHHGKSELGDSEPRDDELGSAGPPDDLLSVPTNLGTGKLGNRAQLHR